MNIIFGDAAKQLPDSYIILELDTIVVQPVNQRIETWCVVESVPANELVVLDKNKKMHSELMSEYRSQHWERCLELIGGLAGLWEGEVDSFYEELKKRINNFKQNPPEPGWDGSLVRHAAAS